MTAAVLLSEVAEINPRTDLAGLRPLDEVDFFPMAAVDAEKTIASAEEKRPLQEVSKGFTCFKDGDVLLAKITPCFENGKISQASVRTLVAFGSTEFHVVRCGQDLDSRYLVHFLRRQDVRVDGERKMTGSGGQRRVPKHFLESLEIPLPTLPEQRRIAAILDKADALRTKRREALANLDRLAHSIFLEMFGDPVTNSKGWQKRPLGDVFEIARGGSPRPIDDYITDAPDGINWVMIGDTEQGGKYIRSTKKKIRPEGVKRSRMVKSGDFLLTNSMSFGRPYILKTDGCIHDGWLVLSPKVEDFDADYFYALLGSRAVFSEFSKRAAGATVKNLNIDLVSGVEVAVPPLEKQREFAGAMRKVEASKSRIEAAVGHLSALFNCLQARAFAGEL